MSLFCRHNRFVSECSICSKGTVLDQGQSRVRRKASSGSAGKRSSERAAAPAFSGPHVAGPARPDEDGALTLVRLERVPGGVRLGEWHGSALAKRAPVLPPEDLADLVARATDALQPRDASRLAAALTTELDPAASGDVGVSRGRSGDFKEELRIERLEDGRLRIARWVQRPAVGWELQDAPPMLPAARYAEAIAEAARRGLLSSADVAAAHSPS